MSEVGTYVRPGQVNTYVPDHAATSNLTITFSRNPNKFPLPKYAQYRPVKKTHGLYLRIKAEECARIVNANLSDFVWPDGADRPMRAETEDFRYENYRTTRYDYPLTLGQKAVDEADWGVEDIHQAFNAQKAMTARTTRVVSALETTGNWDADHVAYVEDIEGNSGTWEESTSARMDIKRSIAYATTKILMDTLGVVEVSDLMLLMSPETARKIATSQEIVDQVKQQPSSPEIVSGTTEWLLEQYGLPRKLYGLPVMIEDTVRVTSRRGATTPTKQWALSEGGIFVLARPGSIEAVAGSGPSFSTITCFMKEEMTVEKKHDVDNRRYLAHVVDDFDVVMTAPVSGFYLRGATTETSSGS